MPRSGKRGLWLDNYAAQHRLELMSYNLLSGIVKWMIIIVLLSYKQ